jgi:hypothetical protein
MIPESIIGTLDVFIFAIIFFSLLSFNKKPDEKNKKLKK